MTRSVLRSDQHLQSEDDRTDRPEHDDEAGLHQFAGDVLADPGADRTAARTSGIDHATTHQTGVAETRSETINYSFLIGKGTVWL